MRGLAKHRKSGKTPKSPKFKHAMKREAEKNNKKPKQYEYVESINSLFKK